MTWISCTYDPELNMLFVGTGNPQPVIASKGRAGANLFTESIVALNADTGKLVWYFQPSPHDTHDWDAVQTPVLFDGEIDGKQAQIGGAGEPQWLVLCVGSRNGQELRHLSIRENELGKRRRCQGAAHPESG